MALLLEVRLDRSPSRLAQEGVKTDPLRLQKEVDRDLSAFLETEDSIEPPVTSHRGAKQEIPTRLSTTLRVIPNPFRREVLFRSDDYPEPFPPSACKPPILTSGVTQFWTTLAVECTRMPTVSRQGRGLECGLRIEAFPPPFQKAKAWPRTGASRLPAGSGALIWHRPRREGVGNQPIRRVVSRLKQEHPEFPVSMVFPQTEGPGEWQPTEEAHLFHPGLRAVFVGPPCPQRYKAELSRMTLHGIHHWLLQVSRPTNLSEVGAITRLSQLFFRESYPQPNLPVRLRNTLRGLNLPGPKRWEMVARVAPVLLQLQATSLTVSQAALRAGYPDGSALRRDCRTLFGIPPSSLRLQAGWEWFLFRFVTKGRKDD
jgi:AraC-like DNA-binding protein